MNKATAASGIEDFETQMNQEEIAKANFIIQHIQSKGGRQFTVNEFMTILARAYDSVIEE